MLYKSNLSTLKTIGYSWIYSWYIVMSIVYGPSGRFTHVMDILHCLGQVLYLGRALRTKEILPDFLKWRRVTRHPLVFHGLTGSQRIPGFGVSHHWSTHTLALLHTKAVQDLLEVLPLTYEDLILSLFDLHDKKVRYFT